MKYAGLYTAMAHQPTFDQLVRAGWFSFLELMSAGFEKLIAMCQSGFELDDDEKALVEKFGEALWLTTMLAIEPSNCTDVGWWPGL